MTNNDEAIRTSIEEILSDGSQMNQHELFISVKNVQKRIVEDEFNRVVNEMIDDGDLCKSQDNVWFAGAGEY